jgi:hypothetical protein
MRHNPVRQTAALFVGAQEREGQMRRLKLAACIFVFAFSASNSVAQTADETTAFIKERVAECDNYENYPGRLFAVSHNIKNDVIFREDVTLSVSLARTEVTLPGDMTFSGWITSMATRSFKLSNIEAAPVVNGKMVVLRCASGDCLGGAARTLKVEVLNDRITDNQLRTLSKYHPAPITGNETGFTLCSEDAARRVGRAFERLILLSGGKRPVF